MIIIFFPIEPLDIMKNIYHRIDVILSENYFKQLIHSLYSAQNMIHEIGFIHMAATILGGGLLDGKIQHTDNYEKEKERVNALLSARYDIEGINCRSRVLVANLIKGEITRWWLASRYNLQIDSLREEIMELLRTEVEKTGAKVLKVNTQNMFVENFSDYDFTNIQLMIHRIYPGMIAYYDSDVDQISNTPRY